MGRACFVFVSSSPRVFNLITLLLPRPPLPLPPVASGSAPPAETGRRAPSVTLACRPLCAEHRRKGAEPPRNPGGTVPQQGGSQQAPGGAGGRSKEPERGAAAGGHAGTMRSSCSTEVEVRRNGLLFAGCWSVSLERWMFFYGAG